MNGHPFRSEFHQLRFHVISNQGYPVPVQKSMSSKLEGNPTLAIASHNVVGDQGNPHAAESCVLATSSRRAFTKFVAYISAEKSHARLFARSPTSAANSGLSK